MNNKKMYPDELVDAVGFITLGIIYSNDIHKTFEEDPHKAIFISVLKALGVLKREGFINFVEKKGNKNAPESKTTYRRSTNKTKIYD